MFVHCEGEKYAFIKMKWWNFKLSEVKLNIKKTDEVFKQNVIQQMEKYDLFKSCMFLGAKAPLGLASVINKLIK